MSWRVFLGESLNTSYIWPSHTYGKARTILVVLAAGYGIKKLASYLRNHNKFELNQFKHTPGVILLHQFSRGKTCPNLSPFALKIETFLRLAKIPYEVDCTVPFGPKGKCPWVHLENGQPLADSNFIITRIISDEKAKGSKARLPPGDAGLSRREQGALEGLRVLMEEHLFWVVIYWRYYLDGCKAFLVSQKFPPFLNFIFPIFMGVGIRKRCQWHGIAKHSPDEVFLIGKAAVAALDDYLGDAPFFCGREPGTADCAIFGSLAQFMWNAPGTPYEALLTDDYPRIGAFCTRMKERAYPDWDDLTAQPFVPLKRR